MVDGRGAGCPVFCAGVNSLLRPSGWRACGELVRWMRRERIALVQTFFSNAMSGPLAGPLGGGAVVISSRRNLNQWHDRSAWMAPGILLLQRLRIDPRIAWSPTAGW